MLEARAEARLVPIGQRASGRMDFRSARSHLLRANPSGSRRVQHSLLSAMICHAPVRNCSSPCSIARGCAEIIEIRRRAAGVKFVIARDGTSPRFKSAPGLVVAIGEFFRACILEREVPDRHDGAWNPLDNLCRGLRPRNNLAVGDISRRQQHRVVAGSTGCAGSGGLNRLCSAICRRTRMAKEQRRKQNSGRQVFHLIPTVHYTRLSFSLEFQPEHKLNLPRQSRSHVRRRVVVVVIVVVHRRVNRSEELWGARNRLMVKSDRNSA